MPGASVQTLGFLTGPGRAQLVNNRKCPIEVEPCHAGHAEEVPSWDIIPHARHTSRPAPGLSESPKLGDADLAYHTPRGVSLTTNPDDAVGVRWHTNNGRTAAINVLWIIAFLIDDMRHDDTKHSRPLIVRRPHGS